MNTARRLKTRSILKSTLWWCSFLPKWSRDTMLSRRRSRSPAPWYRSALWPSKMPNRYPIDWLFWQSWYIRTLQNKKILDSVTTKIIGQITCKLGGTLWRVKIPLKKTMAVGIDLTHDKARGRYTIKYLRLVSVLNISSSQRDCCGLHGDH